MKLDNQQERLHFYIGYLAGMIDGEGSCQMQTKYVRGDRHYYTPKVMIANNDPKIVQLTIDALKYLGIPFHIWSPKIHGSEKKPVHRIQIVGIKRVKKLAELLTQYNLGKMERLQLLLDFCNYRLSFTPQELNSGHTTTYTNKEDEFKQQLLSLNSFRGAKSSETIRFSV